MSDHDKVIVSMYGMPDSVCKQRLGNSDGQSGQEEVSVKLHTETGCPKRMTSSMSNVVGTRDDGKPYNSNRSR